MGCCESKNKVKKGAIQGNIQNEQPEKVIRNDPISISQTIIEEDTSEYSSNSFIELSEIASKNLSKVLCRILIKAQGKEIIGAGFILGIQIDLEGFICLITNGHIISNESINNNNTINLVLEENKTVNIKLDINKRYIKNFIDEGLDITVVEILEEDNFNNKVFLEPDLDIPINNELIKYEISIPQYIIKEKKLMNAKGIIKSINKNELSHSVRTEKFSLGSPIFLKTSNNVIGIHKKGIEKGENMGDFIYPVVKIIEEDIRKKRYNGKYINGRYIYDDGQYYVGEYKNNIPNGKGIKYNKNGIKLYEGDFINGKFEGYGKYIWEDGLKYIGQWKNGLSHGKGTMYYPEGNIKYEGDWVNNKYEGFGKDFSRNGYYSIGQFKNGKLNGKATEYYPNGEIEYEGDWVNDKPEGNGIYKWKDGYYYIGQFKNELKNGKGIMYYPNGSIEYEGDFVNDKYEGNGRHNLKDGCYYIGHFRDGKWNGKGILYGPYGDIIRQGKWINNVWYNDFFDHIK